MRLALALLLALAACPAHAHKPSDSYLTIHADGSGLRGQWDIALRDLDFAIGLDADGNAEISWGELRAKHAEIAAYALARLSLTANRGRCKLTAAEQLVDRHSDGTYAVLRFTAQCAGADAVREIELEYGLFFDLDPTHRGLLRLQHGGGAIAGILSPERARQRFAIAETSKLAQFLDYGREGVWHIAIGIDHILFLLALMLGGGSLLRLIGIATGFTVGHTITLGLAAFAVVRPPDWLIEPLIALSIALVAAEAFTRKFDKHRWKIAFGFGLVHGFGFANALTRLELSMGDMAAALFGYNLGVELGQVVIALMIAPLVLYAHREGRVRFYVVRGVAAAIFAAGMYWFLVRVLG